MIPLIPKNYQLTHIFVLLISVLLGCGRAATDLQGKIVNGQPASDLQGKIVNGQPAHGHPYLVTIQVLVDEDEKYYIYDHSCGGAIIDDRTVVTSAHVFFQHHPNPACWVDKSNKCYRIVAGKHDLNKRYPEKEQVFSISFESIKIHERYDHFHFDNDIATIHLEKPFVFNEYVQPIRLMDPSKTYGNTGVIAGWGQNMQGARIDTLREANVTIFTNDVCSDQWGDDFHSEEMMCASGNEVSEDNGLVADACWGDSGGPLVVTDVNDSTTKYLIGIISWGFECGYKEYPGLYTRVQTYLNWINDQLEKQRERRILKIRHNMRQRARARANRSHTVQAHFHGRQ